MAGNPGRPRSAAADTALMDASIALLVEEGPPGLTMEGIARRAGVGKTTLYRRWSHPHEVLAAAVASLVDEITIPDTGSVRCDLTLLLRRAVGLYRGPRGKAMPGLVAAMAVSPELAAAVREGFLARRRASLAVVVQRGIHRGELRADADVEVALDFLGGPLFYRLLVTGAPLDEGFADVVVDTLLRGLAPRAQHTEETT